MSALAPVELHLDQAQGIATLTFNRPEVLNAIDVPMARAIRDAVVPLGGREDVRCIVLAGAGRAFVAGGDVARFADDFDSAADVVDQLLDALHPAIETLAKHDAPVLASVRGAVAGAGLSLLAGCDLAIAADSSRFLMAYDRVGAAPDCGGTWYLPRKVGVRAAAELMLLGEAWDAARALQAGLVNTVVPERELAERTQALAAQLANRPTRALGAYKRLVAQAAHTPLHEHLQAERAAFKRATASADFREGVSAFLQRREPAFRGR
ncbi:enoyl-CoA hydratase-related protein [Xanthomonas campestris pv. phormiicola]|nr:enoyl-CoA hydratase/isomerase family protein [Xanthomonas campestris pv. phormiicola]UYC15831.1 enoyl-CoA hydratase-related protein [Xanthomonas campestris pv. phormiicola]